MVILNAILDPKHGPDLLSVAITAVRAVAEVKEKGKVVDLVRSVLKASLSGQNKDCESPRAIPL